MRHKDKCANVWAEITGKNEIYNEIYVIRNLGTQIKETRQWHSTEQAAWKGNYIHFHIQQKNSKRDETGQCLINSTKELLKNMAGWASVLHPRSTRIQSNTGKPQLFVICNSRAHQNEEIGKCLINSTVAATNECDRLSWMSHLRSTWSQSDTGIHKQLMQTLIAERMSLGSQVKWEWSQAIQGYTHIFIYTRRKCR